jgi:hypothetical protein
MLHLNHLLHLLLQLQELILVVKIHIKLHHLQLQQGKRLMVVSRKQRGKILMVAVSRKQRGKILMVVKMMMLLYMVKTLIQMAREGSDVHHKYGSTLTRRPLK